MNADSDATFTIHTADTSGKDPKVDILVDGTRALEESANVKSDYTVHVAAGEHEISVDNVGSDWIEIASYELSESGSTIQAYILVSDTMDVAAGWLVNTEYTSGNNESMNTQLSIEGFIAGDFSVTWFDCQSGETILVEQVTSAAGSLVLSTPTFIWDVAFLVQ